MIQGWLSEKTRNKIKILKGDPLNELLKYCNIDQIPYFLGGENSVPTWQDKGPWNKYEVVEASEGSKKVGIRFKRFGDGSESIEVSK